MSSDAPRSKRSPTPFSFSNMRLTAEGRGGPQRRRRREISPPLGLCGPLRFSTVISLFSARKQTDEKGVGDRFYLFADSWGGLP
jgi:hypothetical protein